MCSELAILGEGVGKAYRLYDRPLDRVKSLLFGPRWGEEFWALRGVDLAVERGESVGIIGRNGSGKSTLLQLVCGTVQPSLGQLQVKGRVAALLELGAGFNPDFTGRENVHLSASILGLSDADIAARFAAIEAFAEIGGFIDRPVREYSSGMYARLAFAVCAHVDADILVIDEILAVGDAVFQQKCMRFLRGFRQHGTLLLVSHDERMVLELCDRAIWLDRGEVRASGASKEVYRRYFAALAEAAAEGTGFGMGGQEEPRPSQPITRQDADSIEIFDFAPDGPWHGLGGATIEHAGFFGPEGHRLADAQGGEDVELRIACSANRVIERPVVGYVLRNRLGQNIFGDNTYLTYKDAALVTKARSAFLVSFRFLLPYLPTGDYVVDAFLFEGSAAEHKALHHLLGATVLRIDSAHISQGSLANVPTRATLLEVEHGSRSDVL